MKRLVLLLWVGLLALAGCDGATSVSKQDRCNSSGRAGTCTVQFGSIAGGAYRYEVENSQFRSGTNAVEVTAQVTVETGTLLVWLEDPQGDKHTVTVEPGQMAEIGGTAWVTGMSDERSFSVYFEPQGEGEAKRAENVQAEIRYSMP